MLTLICVQQKVLCNWGMTLQQSSAVHIQALVSADVILLGNSSKLRLLVINLASVPGGQLVNYPTAQSPARCALYLNRQEMIMTKYFNIREGFFLIFFWFHLYSCIEDSSQKVQSSYFSKIVSQEYSPNGKYKFTLGELNDSIHPSTQLLVDFDGCGGSVYVPSGWNLGIKVFWKTNDTIVVVCNKSFDKMRRSFSQCFRDKVYIQYIDD